MRSNDADLREASRLLDVCSMAFTTDYLAPLRNLIASAIAAERERCIYAVNTCASLDENGYICEKASAISKIMRGKMPDAPQSTPLRSQTTESATPRSECEFDPDHLYHASQSTPTSSGPAEAEATAHAAGGEAKQPAGPELDTAARLVAEILTRHGLNCPSPDEGSLDDVEIERWAACCEVAERVTAAERERCARIADAVATHRGSTPYDSGHFQGCRDIALRLR